MKMRRTLWIMFTCLCLMLVACSKDKDTPSKGSSNDGKETSSEVYPLTGEPVTDDDEVNKRAVAVMINNHVKARPYTGITDADVVFEILAEGEITRLMAIYHSVFPERVGSVRSAREYYFELANGYNAIYTYHGAAKFVDQMIKDRGIDYINGAKYDNDRVLFERTSDRKAPHNSYVLFSNLYDKAESLEYDLEKTPEPLPFNDDEEQSGTDATSIQINYSNNDAYNPTFVFDESTGEYKRSVQGEAVRDAANNEEVRVKNIFIVETTHHVFDSEGRREIDLESGGTAYLFTNGKMEEVEWENNSGEIIPVKNGKKVGFTPGKSWINIVPTNPGIDKVVTVGKD